MFSKKSVSALFFILLAVGIGVGCVQLRMATQPCCPSDPKRPSDPDRPDITVPVPGPIIEIINDGGNGKISYDDIQLTGQSSASNEIDPRLLAPTVSGLLVEGTAPQEVEEIPNSIAVVIKFTDGTNFQVRRGNGPTDPLEWTCFDGTQTTDLVAGDNGKLPDCVRDSGRTVDNIFFGAHEGDIVVLRTNDDS